MGEATSPRMSASSARPSTAAQLDELELKEHRLASQVGENEDIQAAVSELKQGLTGQKDDALQDRLDELDRRANNLELFGLSMLQLRQEVQEVKRSCKHSQNR